MRVTYISSDGVATTVEAQDGQSMMETAVANGVPGIIGECGGSATCGTCHVYVDAAFIERLPPPSDVEDDLLDCTAAERQPNSRLACQIKASPDLDGLVLNTPGRQR